MVPLRFFVALTDFFFLGKEALHVFLQLLIGLMLYQDLQRSLNKALLQLLHDCIEDSGKVAPVMNLAEDTFFGHRVSHLVQKFLHRARPHVHVVLQDAELARS